MVHVLVEHAEAWPEDGPYLVRIPPMQVEVAVSGDTARKRVNGYLVK
jgi:hypothetical protein